MKNKKIILSLYFILISLFILVGCSSNNASKDMELVKTDDMNLIYEETISPNEEYVETE